MLAVQDMFEVLNPLGRGQKMIPSMLFQVKEEVEKLRTDNADHKKELARLQKELSDKTKEAEDAKVDAVNYELL